MEQVVAIEVRLINERERRGGPVSLGNRYRPVQRPSWPGREGLLALMLLIESRRATRTTPNGDLVLVSDQDRGPLGP